MKQIKLQEQFFGKDKEFRTTKILKKHPELLNGKPVEFEVVSPDYEQEFSHFNYYGEGYSQMLKDQNSIPEGCYEIETETTPRKVYKTKGKKLGTMKLELEMVDRFIHKSRKPSWYPENIDYGIQLSCERVGMSKQEYDFIKDNEYFKNNDLVVVLKVSEVERYV